MAMAETGTGSREDWINKRKGRYMAQLLEVFEEEIEPLISSEQAKKFKALARRKMGALAADAVELLNLENMAINGAAQDIRDRVFADGAAQPGAKG